MDEIQGKFNKLLLKTIRDKHLEYSICDNFTNLIETRMVFIEAHKHLSGQQKKNFALASMKLIVQIKISNEVVKETLIPLEQLVPARKPF